MSRTGPTRRSSGQLPSHRPPTIFFSAGEPSGDLHAANLIRALKSQRKDIQAVGYGGPEMAAAGCRLHADLTRLAMMWFLRVLMNLHVFYRLVCEADRCFRYQRPDAVVLVDFPGFNWWIARRAKVHGIPVFYYAPPQIWAWASWRIRKMRRLIDHVLCTLPFEASWFRERGCRAEFVGHPFFDETHQHRLDEDFIRREQQKPGPLVAILPGSRTQEVTHNLGWLLKAAAKVRAVRPDVRFAVASFKPEQAQIARAMVAEHGLAIDVHVRKTPELVHLSHCCMAVSGSVSLELLYHTRPTVVLYWIDRVAYFVQGWFRRVKYITLVNLLSSDELYPSDLSPYDPLQADAHKVLFPEYLTWQDKSSQIACHLLEWLSDEEQRQALIARLAELKERVGHGGASRRAAEYILAHLPLQRTAVPRPHFVPAARPATDSVGPSNRARYAA